MNCSIRPIEEHEISQLKDFLYLAIHQSDPSNLIPRSVVEEPEVAAYIEGWGEPDDLCLVAVEAGELIGAVWTRIIAGKVRGFGNVDAETPEFSISILPERRSGGIGSTLMTQMLDLLTDRGYARASLSVQKSNRALRLYERLGFRAVADRGDELVMVRDLLTN